MTIPTGGWRSCRIRSTSPASSSRRCRIPRPRRTTIGEAPFASDDLNNENEIEEVMDKKIFGIGIMSLTAIVLLVANFMPMQQASALSAIKDRDYSMVTGQLNGGGEALYLIDGRAG